MLRSETGVDAVELFDRASLRECEADEEMVRLVPDMKGADPMAAALLIECRGQDEKVRGEEGDGYMDEDEEEGVVFQRPILILSSPSSHLQPPSPLSLLLRATLKQALADRIEEVNRSLVGAGLPFGAKASAPQPITFYPFHHDEKNCKKFWDVRKVCALHVCVCVCLL